MTSERPIDMTGAIYQAAQDVAAEIVEPEPVMHVGFAVCVAEDVAWPYGAMSGAKMATNRLIATIARPICAGTLSL